ESRVTSGNNVFRRVPRINATQAAQRCQRSADLVQLCVPDAKSANFAFFTPCNSEAPQGTLTTIFHYTCSLPAATAYQQKTEQSSAASTEHSSHEVMSGVENRRSSGSLPVAFMRAAFAGRASVRFGMALFPVPAHRTGQAHLAHPALGERFTVSPTESCLSE